MKNEKVYNVVLKESEVRELQRCILYQVSTILEPKMVEENENKAFVDEGVDMQARNRLIEILQNLNTTAGKLEINKMYGRDERD